MAIDYYDANEGFGDVLNWLALTQRGAAMPERAPAYNALAANGGPTRAAAEAYGSNPYVDADWTRGRVEGVNPELVALLADLREETGIPFIVTEGLRDADRQARLVASGASQTMNSKHIPGNALDIGIMNPDGSINYDFEAYRPLGNAFKRLAEERGLSNAVWGGDWESLRDGVHFQLG